MVRALEERNAAVRNMEAMREEMALLRDELVYEREERNKLLGQVCFDFRACMCARQGGVL